MPTILLVTTSPNGAASVSTRLGRELADRLAAERGARVVLRDLAAAPPPHLDADTVGVFQAPTGDLTAAQEDALALSDRFIAELVEADAIVIAAPMWNFGSPSALKSWIDHLARAGVTFRFTEAGPEGLLGGRPVYVVSSRGGFYTPGRAAAPMDHQTPFLKTILGFLGLKDLTFVYAEGQAIGPDVAAQEVAAARARIAELTETAGRAA